MKKQEIGDILMAEHQTFEWKIGEINRTNQILNELQNKMNNYFDRKKTESHLLASDDKYVPFDFQMPLDKKSKESTFKLFTKNNKNDQMKIQDIHDKNQRIDPKYQTDFIDAKKKTEIAKIIEEVQAMQILIKKKISLKQEKLHQLEREIELQNEEKVHLYRINTELEQQLAQTIKNHQLEMKSQQSQLDELEQEYQKLKKIYSKKKAENKTLKKEEEVLKTTYKNVQKSRKDYIETDIKRNNSKQKIIKVKQQDGDQNYLRGLVIQLDKLKQMVKKKMKKSQSGPKIRHR